MNEHETEDYLKSSPTAINTFAAATTQLSSVALANLRIAPVMAKFCGVMLTELMANGFTRDEAISIIKSASGKP